MRSVSYSIVASSQRSVAASGRDREILQERERIMLTLRRDGMKLWYAPSVVACVLVIAPISMAGDCDCDMTELLKRLASDDDAGDHFGESVSISGDTVIIGAHSNDDPETDAGTAYIFERNQGGTDNWGQLTTLTAADAAVGDHFGQVAISGDIAIVGAFEDDDVETGSGSAYIFYRNQGGTNAWGQFKKITAGDPEEGDRFGVAVGIDGDYVVVGAHQPTEPTAGTGKAYVFYRNQGGTDNWGQVKKLTASDGAKNDFFGSWVAISGDTVVIGAQLHGTSGAAYLFQRDHGGTNNWGERAELEPSDSPTDALFGAGVDINGDYVIVGAYRSDDDGFNSGSAYIFARDEGGTDNWGEVKKLTASDASAQAHFGFGVAINGSLALVGAPDALNPMAGPGATYVFNRHEGDADNWGELRKLESSDGAGSDLFGHWVAFDSGISVIGAPRDDDGGSESGSMYIFDISCLDCPWDLNGDGSVGAADLLSLLADWGTDPDEPPDFDCNGDVGTSDLLTLLSHWGDCGVPPVPIENVEDCVTRFYPDDMDALIACIEAFAE